MLKVVPNAFVDIIKEKGIEGFVVNFIESYFNKYIAENFAIWDYYILNYENYENYENDEFTTLTVYYYTWEGNSIVKGYIQHVIKIPYTNII